jgi:hypothetical protein
LRVLETDHWSLLLPPEWMAEQDEGSILISDRDDVGCLEISVLLSENGAFDEAQVRQLCENPERLESVSLAGYGSWVHGFEEEDAAIREWFIPAPWGLVYITYSCDLDNRAMDDAAVDDILSTLRLESAD